MIPTLQQQSLHQDLSLLRQKRIPPSLCIIDQAHNDNSDENNLIQYTKQTCCFQSLWVVSKKTLYYNVKKQVNIDTSVDINSPVYAQYYYKELQHQQSLFNSYHRSKIALVIFIILLSVLFRVGIGLFGHSGYQVPPLYGDFEAQRHWMEITVNTPLNEWYVQTPNNDLQYWGLDYPPISAFWAYITGLLAKLIYPQMVELYTSRGIEDNETRLFMRVTVILADLLLYIPSVIILTNSITKIYSTGLAYVSNDDDGDDNDNKKNNKNNDNNLNNNINVNNNKNNKNKNHKAHNPQQNNVEINSIIKNYLNPHDDKLTTELNNNNYYNYIFLITSLLLQPLLLLIDHGHFQYNSLCFSLLFFSISFALQHRFRLVAIIFPLCCFAKQTGLYFALPLFVYITSNLLFYPSNNNIQTRKKTYNSNKCTFSFAGLVEFCILAIIATFTFLLCFSPFIMSVMDQTEAPSLILGDLDSFVHGNDLYLNQLYYNNTNDTIKQLLSSNNPIQFVLPIQNPTLDNNISSTLFQQSILLPIFYLQQFFSIWSSTFKKIFSVFTATVHHHKTIPHSFEMITMLFKTSIILTIELLKSFFDQYLSSVLIHLPSSFHQAIKPIIIRMFPFKRGLFEDKVASLWCVSNTLIKWHMKFDISILTKFSTITTLLCIIPSLFKLMFTPTNGMVDDDDNDNDVGDDDATKDHDNNTNHPVDPATNPSTMNNNPTIITTTSSSSSITAPKILQKQSNHYIKEKQLLYSLTVAGFAFFLCSMQVHEKTVMYALLPLCLLSLQHPLLYTSATIIANTTCMFLLVRDGQFVPYLIIQSIFILLSWKNNPSLIIYINNNNNNNNNELSYYNHNGNNIQQKKHRHTLYIWFNALSKLITYIINIFPFIILYVKNFIPPPAHLPHLVELFTVTVGFILFAFTLVYLTLQQYNLTVKPFKSVT